MTIDLNAIKDRANAATAGPWRQTDEHGVIDAGAFPAIVADCGFAENAADASFIAHARADIPALVAEVERLREALEEIRDDARSRLPCDALGDGASPERQLGRKLDRIAARAAGLVRGW